MGLKVILEKFLSNDKRAPLRKERIRFYPRATLASAGILAIAACVCPTVRPSVCHKSVF